MAVQICIADDWDRALEVAENDPRIQDIYADFTDIRLVPDPSDTRDLYLFRIMQGDSVKGIAVVSLDEQQLVEFRFQTSEYPEKEASLEEEEPPPPSFRYVLWHFRPHLEGATLAWVSFVLACLFLGDFSRFISRRNLEVVLLYSLCPFLSVIWVNPHLAYTGIFFITLLYFVYCLISVRYYRREESKPNVSSNRMVLFVLALAILFHVQKVYESGIDDSGIWSVTGGQYIIESGHLPYGTPFGFNCVYGPLMYYLHIPINFLFPPRVQFDLSHGTATLPAYEQIEMRGAQTVVLLFDLAAMVGLYLFGKKYQTRETGYLLALIYAINPYILGMGGAFGLQQTSHIVGIPLVLFALLFFTHPLVTGLLLGCASGILYYPVFLFPLWIGYYFHTGSWKQAIRFLVGYTGVGICCVVMIFLQTVPADPTHSVFQAFLNDTVYQQQFKEGYGTSSFSFWGQYPYLAGWVKPGTGLIYLLFCLALAFLPRHKNFSQLIALSSCVLIGTQLVLSHGGGTYIGFYIAPLILTLFCSNLKRE